MLGHQTFHTGSNCNQISLGVKERRGGFFKNDNNEMETRVNSYEVQRVTSFIAHGIQGIILMA